MLITSEVFLSDDNFSRHAAPAQDFDWLLEDNRRVQPLLQNNGYNVTYHEAPAGHNFTFWQNELPQALMSMFPTE